MTFNQEIVLVLIDKLIIGLIIGVAGFTLNKMLERFKSEQALLKDTKILREQEAMEHLQRQIEELYSPLLALIQQSRLIYQVATKKIPSIQKDIKQIVSSHEADMYRYFVEKYFLPINLQIAELIRAKIYLISDDKVPDSFLHFFEHQLQFDCLHRLWSEKGISSDEITGRGWPPNFEKDVEASLTNLRSEYLTYTRHIKEISRN